MRQQNVFTPFIKITDFPKHPVVYNAAVWGTLLINLQFFIKKDYHFMSENIFLRQIVKIAKNIINFNLLKTTKNHELRK